MNSQIKQKLQSQYLQLQRAKLESDPYYQQLIEKCHKRLQYTVPVITIKHGFMSQEMPENYEWAKAELDEYVNTMYPTLSNRKIGLIEYVKYHGLEPWNRADIGEPISLTLSQIDRRLSLFKEYLKYRLYNWKTLPHVLDTFKQVGLLYYYPTENELTLEFDEWLYLENYDQLVTVHWNNY